MTIHQKPPVTRVVIRLPKGMSVREALAAKIEALINKLDSLEPDPDLEPSIGQLPGGPVDAEGDSADDEPSLGSLDANIDQRSWNCGCSSDAELDDADDEAEPDDEDGGDTEPNGDERDFSTYDGFTNACHVTRDVTRDAVVLL